MSPNNTPNNCEEIRKLAIELMNTTMSEAREAGQETTQKLLKLKEVFESIQSKKHWKEPCGCSSPLDFDQAVEMAASVAWYHGGLEVAEGNRDGTTVFAVYSKGYYHYCG
jgi:hypothetical protein